MDRIIICRIILYALAVILLTACGEFFSPAPVRDTATAKIDIYLPANFLQKTPNSKATRLILATLTVSARDMDTLTATETISNNRVSFVVQVPAGDDRVFSIRIATDDPSISYTGTSNATNLSPGTAVSIPISIDASSLGEVIIGAVAVDAGVSHGIALDSNGDVWTWGDNRMGQLGTLDTLERVQPVKLSHISNAIAVGAGKDFSQIILSNGNILSYGNNTDGQLGGTSEDTCYDETGSAINCSISGITLTALAVQNPTAISGGDGYSLVLTAAGNVYSWGANTGGQLGNGSTAPAASPIIVRNTTNTADLSNITKVIARGRHSFALDSGGKVWVWGINDASAPIGNPDLPLTPVNRPQEVCITTTTCSAWLSNIVDIAATGNSAVAVDSNGEVWSWGSDINQQLGDGDLSPANRTYAQKVCAPAEAAPCSVFISGITGLAMSESSVLAWEADGTSWTWGNGDLGSLGNNEYGGAALYPSPLAVCATAANGGCPSQLSGTVSAVSRGGAMYVVNNQNELLAWGIQESGQTGNGITLNASIPVPVITAESVSQVSTGQLHTLTLASSKQVIAFGDNNVGQLGQGNTTFVDYDQHYVCANGQVAPCGINLLSAITAVMAGQTHNMALDSNGEVWTWGSGSTGELGVNDVAQTEAPVRVCATSGCGSWLNNIVEIAAWEHSLARASDGTVYGWGDNFSGQLNTGNTSNQLLPVSVGFAGSKQIAAGYRTSYIVTAGGGVKALGRNTNGQLGNNTVTSSNGAAAVDVCTSSDCVSKLQNITQVAAGNGFAVALDSNGNVWSWGLNSDGQLGDGTTVERHIAVRVCAVGESGGCSNYLAGITKIAAGVDHVLALDASGRVYAWGANQYGQLGNASFTDQPVAVRVCTSNYDKACDTEISGIVDIAAGNTSSYAVSDKGQLYAWGIGWNNRSGQGLDFALLPERIAR